ncbi:DNRLRE domain-containing protein [Corallococcus exercitus]|uniref:DNRLRE domain-containing protein n=1 Tax=Corallococcus exercitus TaxID=2316736 RepID=A0A7Y4KNF8_9BACT|nr:DNRLRE domain-containing protein [Corallococcus exercitus]NOK35989.1 DNRLRE domain-containing protein [Corallococcus exercitus]
MQTGWKRGAQGVAAFAMLALLPRCGGATGAQDEVQDGALKAVEQAVLPTVCQPRSYLDSRTLVAVADASVRNDQPDVNMSTQSTLYVDAAPTRYQSYLRFQQEGEGGELVQARLRLYAKQGTNTGVSFHPVPGGVYPPAVTWNTRPTEGAAVATVASVANDAWLTAEVKGAVLSRHTFDLGVLPLGDDGAEFSSEEASNASRRPQLDTVYRYDWCTYRGSSTPSQAWAKTLGGTAREYVRALINLPDGSGFVLGGSYTDGPAQAGGPALPGPSGFLVARFDTAAQHQWSRAYGVGQQVELGAMTVTPVGNVLVVGTYQGSPDLGTGALPYIDSSTGALGMFVLKLSPTGNPVWANGFRAEKRPAWGEGQVYPSFVVPTVVATDANGSVIVAGHFEGYTNLGGSELYAGSMSEATDDQTQSLFLVKYDYNGGHQWSQVFETLDEFTEANALTADAAGNILMGGRGNNPVLATPGMRVGTAFVARFTPSGAPVWGYGLKGAVGRIRGLAFLPDGGVAFAGGFNGTFTFQGQTYSSHDPMHDVRPDDGVFGTLTASGGEGWVRVLTTQPSGDVAEQVAVDGAGNIVVNGVVSADTFDFGGGALGTPGLPRTQPFRFVASFSPTGSHRWSRMLGPQVSSAFMAVSPDGSTRLGFTFEGSTPVGATTFISSGQTDMGLIQFAP